MDLTLATKEELWDELSSRYTACILIYEKMGDKGPTTVTDMSWKGSFCHILGLMEWGKEYIAAVKHSHFYEPADD